jgi:hypothetical protein
MRRRMRRHLINIFVILVIMFGGGVAAYLAKVAVAPGAGPHPSWTKLLVLGCALGGVLGGIVYGWWSAWKNMRCPACGQWIYVYLRWRYSLWASTVGDQCPKCGVTLFDPSDAKGARRLIMLVVGVAFAAGVVAAIAGFIFQKSRN